MTTPINSTVTPATYQPIVPTAAVPVVSTVSSASAGALSSTAVSLSGAAAVVASLGGGAGAEVYTPSGLLNSIQQAGTAQNATTVPTSGSATTNVAQQSTDQAVVSSLQSTPETSGVYDGSGAVQSLTSSSTLSSSWASILKTNPELSGSVIAASYAQGIISTLQVTA